MGPCALPLDARLMRGGWEPSKAFSAVAALQAVSFCVVHYPLERGACCALLRCEIAAWDSDRIARSCLRACVARHAFRLVVKRQQVGRAASHKATLSWASNTVNNLAFSRTYSLELTCHLHSYCIHNCNHNCSRGWERGGLPDGVPRWHSCMSVDQSNLCITTHQLTST